MKNISPLSGNEWDLIFAGKRIEMNDWLDALLQYSAGLDDLQERGKVLKIWRGLYDVFTDYETYCKDLGKIGALMRETKGKYQSVTNQRNAYKQNAEDFKRALEALQQQIFEKPEPKQDF